MTEPTSPFLTTDSSVPFFPAPPADEVRADLVSGTYSVPSAVKIALRALAAREGESIGIIVRRALAQYTGVILPAVLLSGKKRSSGGGARRRRRGDKRTRPERVAAELVELRAEISAEQPTHR